MNKLEQIKKEFAGYQKYITCEKTEAVDAEKSIIGWGSKPTPDRDKELIESKAWRLERFKKNPVLLLSHKYDIPPVGKILWIKSDPNGLKFKAQFANSERGQELYQLYKDGIMSAFSVGFTPMENGYIDNPQEPSNYKGLKRVYKDVELLEISCVSVPANSDALVEFVKSGKVKNKQLSDELQHVIELVDEEEVVEKTKTTDEPAKPEESAAEDTTIKKEDDSVIKTDEEPKEEKTELSEIEQLREELKAIKEALPPLVPVDASDNGSKTLSPAGEYSIYDISNSVSNALNKLSIDGISEYSKYIVDLYPSQYPSGSVVFSCYSNSKTVYYKIDYIFSNGTVTFQGDPEEVKQSWIVDRYGKEIEQEDVVQKIGMVLSGRNRKLVEDAISALENLLNAAAKSEEFEEDDDFDLETKDLDEEEEEEEFVDDNEYEDDDDDFDLDDEDESEEEEEEIDIDEEELKNILTSAVKSSVEKLNIKQTIENSLKAITGKVM